MEIIVGKKAGFCGGVKRAVEETEKFTYQNAEKVSYCLGNLVHNPVIMEKLFKNGLKVVKNLEEIKENQASVIIRAHGVEKNIYEEAEKKGFHLIDLTCPKVIQIHDIAKEYAEKGFYIFLIGEKTHAEVIGTSSFCGDYYSIIEKDNQVPEAIQSFKTSQKEKLLIISQTTFHLEKFEKIISMIKQELENTAEIVIKNTICDATRLRQEETEKLASQVDYMIIIGGRNSSNTNKLYEISCENCENVVFIEEAKELSSEKIEEMKKYDKIGIMAGASTPQNSIDEVRSLFRESL